MIEVKNLTKRFGSKYALNDVSFTVGEGEVLGFLGPNGAGKTTTMNIITGYLSSTSGTVTVGGHEILEDPMSAKSKMGYLPEHPPLYLDMTVLEYLGFIHRLKKVKLERKKHIADICELVRISDVTGRKIKNLSKGYRQRVGLAQALLGDPEVLILDEPTVGLDPQQIIDIRTLVKELGKNRTIILSSHILPEVQAVCERVIVISQGVIVADGSPHTLARDLSGDRRLTARIAGPKAQVEKLLETLPGLAGFQLLGEREKGAFDWQLEAKPEADIRRGLFFALSEKRWPLLALKSSEMSLEDIFLRLTAKEEEDGEAEPPLPKKGRAREQPPGATGEEGKAKEAIAVPDPGKGKEETVAHAGGKVGFGGILGGLLGGVFGSAEDHQEEHEEDAIEEEIADEGSEE